MKYLNEYNIVFNFFVYQKTIIRTFHTRFLTTNITLVNFNSQIKKTNSEGDFVLNQFETVLRFLVYENKSDSDLV